jgi:uncharacterized protein YjbJ (UPF0337 family)
LAVAAARVDTLRRFRVETDEGGPAMAGADKARNKIQRIRGKAKEAMGRALDDRELEIQGRDDQRASHVKDAGEKLKDAFRPRGRRRP